MLPAWRLLGVSDVRIKTLLMGISLKKEIRKLSSYFLGYTAWIIILHRPFAPCGGNSFQALRLSP